MGYRNRTDSPFPNQPLLSRESLPRRRQRFLTCEESRRSAMPRGKIIIREHRPRDFGGTRGPHAGGREGIVGGCIIEWKRGERSQGVVPTTRRGRNAIISSQTVMRYSASRYMFSLSPSLLFSFRLSPSSPFLDFLLARPFGVRVLPLHSLFSPFHSVLTVNPSFTIPSRSRFAR